MNIPIIQIITGGLMGAVVLFVLVVLLNEVEDTIAANRRNQVLDKTKQHAGTMERSGIVQHIARPVAARFSAHDVEWIVVEPERIEVNR